MTGEPGRTVAPFFIFWCSAGLEPARASGAWGHSFNLKLDLRNVPEKRDFRSALARSRAAKADGVDRRG
jgi:hypothetical protein